MKMRLDILQLKKKNKLNIADIYLFFSQSNYEQIVTTNKKSAKL